MRGAGRGARGSLQFAYGIARRRLLKPTRADPLLVNGLTLLVVIALAIGVFIAYRIGAMRGRREALATLPLREAVNYTPPAAPSPDVPPGAGPVAVPAIPSTVSGEREDLEGASLEKARLVRSLAAEGDALRRAATTGEALRLQLADFAADRRRLLRECAQARADTARYRELVVDLENNALPPLLTGPNSFDDLKLVVGIGPVLERMLHRLGVATYRQIAHWSERDIDAIDAELPEFPGRIRRDGWVTQARELHQSKYGETLPVR
jgi:predicted flap endonuclease-1-like 5' DNA nuclease